MQNVSDLLQKEKGRLTSTYKIVNGRKQEAQIPLHDFLP